jgi:hypothetical protein
MDQNGVSKERLAERMAVLAPEGIHDVDFAIRIQLELAA